MIRRLVDRITANVDMLDGAPDGLCVVECADGVSFDDIGAATEGPVI
ncbi:hypothetical protein [Marivita sp.]|jgi:acyl CoA:acetate/3-ketoacid CoA transferase beta subunit